MALELLGIQVGIDSHLDSQFRNKQDRESTPDYGRHPLSIGHFIFLTTPPQRCCERVVRKRGQKVGGAKVEVMEWIRKDQKSMGAGNLGSVWRDLGMEGKFGKRKRYRETARCGII